MSSYFTAENLCKTFSDRLNGTKTIKFNIQAEKGTLTSIIGSSGSGKSTVLKLISGLELNDKNVKSRIILDGKEIQNLSPSKRGIGFVFQNSALFQNMNVVQNVAYGLQTTGMSRKKSIQLASEFLTHFELAGFDYRNVATLSGGEKQRVAIARTLIVKPKLVLLDEPLSALDAELRKKLADKILEWQKEFGFTAIMVTHDIEEAKRMSQKIISMNDSVI